MTEILNLNRARKAKSRTDNEKKALENRVKFGRTKEQKQAEKLKKEQAEKRLSGHRREADEDE